MNSTADSAIIAKLLAGNFIERRDVKAIQLPNGDYQPHRTGPQPNYQDRPLIPFDLQALTAHVDGTQTFGHYLVKPEVDTARCFVLDIDLNKVSRYHDPDLNMDAEIDPREVWAGPTTTVKRDLAIQLMVMASGLAFRASKLIGCKVIVAYSGNKGMHVIGCFDPGTPAEVVRSAGLLVLDSTKSFEPLRGNNFFKHTVGFPSLDVEVFPKQGEVKADGYGNLVRLPLGINRKSGKKGFFLRLDVEYDKFVLDDPIVVLEKGSVR